MGSERSGYGSRLRFLSSSLIVPTSSLMHHRVTFWFAITILAGLLVLYGVLRVAGQFIAIPHVDVPFHFLGGLAVSLLVGLTLQQRREGSSFLRIVGLTAVVAVLWECGEFILDQGMRPTLSDTAKDLLVGMAGAVVGAVALSLRNRGDEPGS